jgi:phosphoglycerate kinase
MIHSIKQATIKKGTRVFIRADFNVSYNPKGGVTATEATRIIAGLDTIHYCCKKGARVIIATHIGKDGTTSLKGVSAFLKKHVPHQHIETWDMPHIRDSVASLNNGQVLLLPNLRAHQGEESNSSIFAKELASLADVYVNEAFPASHRAHASIVGIAKKIPAYAGVQWMREYTALSKVLTFDRQPFVVILGGAKFDTKLPLIKKFAPKAEALYVAGALMNTFLKEDGYEVGRSVVETVPGIKKLIELGVYTPHTVQVETSDGAKLTKDIDAVLGTDTIMDVGVDAVQELVEVVKRAKLVVWNGPLGFYEKGYTKTTGMLLKGLAESKAYSVVGGGDTLVLVEKLKIKDKLSFVSTAGGAMLEFLGKGTLPGSKVLERKEVV